MSVQTNDEILRLFDEWERGFAPPRFIFSEKNGKLMLDYCLGKYGLVSITYLSEATDALAVQLDWVPQPKPKTQAQLTAEFVAKEQKRIEREKLENSKPFDIAARNKAVETEKDEAKRQATAQAQIENIIANYNVNAGPGRIDASKSEAGQKALRGIRIYKGGKYDAPLTLKVIQQSYNHDTPREIIQAAERATLALADADKPQSSHQRRDEDRRRWLHRPR
jgi:hypothetical protein